MNVHVLQHVPFESLAGLQELLAERSAHVTWTRLYAREVLPDPLAADLLIVLGGPMSVNEVTQCPWLQDEQRFIAARLSEALPMLGICLGAQLMAAALGAQVRANAHKEIGWFPVTGLSVPADQFAWPTKATVFHWHGETFDLPAGAIGLARSEACAQQAFQYGRKAIGLQCHLEMDLPAVQNLMTHSEDHHVPAPWVQSGALMQEGCATHASACQNLLGELLDYLTAPEAVL